MHPPPTFLNTHTQTIVFSLLTRAGILLASQTHKTCFLFNIRCTPFPLNPLDFSRNSHFCHSFLILTQSFCAITGYMFHSIYTELFGHRKGSRDIPKTETVKQTAAAALGTLGKPQLGLSWYARWQAPIKRRTHTFVCK